MIKIPNIDLLSALKAAAAAMPSKPFEPQLGGFYIHAEEDWMDVTCTDAAFTITASANLDEPCAVTDVVVSGKALMDWCGKVDKSATIGMEFTDNTVTVTATVNGKRKSRSVFATMSAEKYPKKGTQHYTALLTMPSEKLHDAFRSVLHCVAPQNESKEVLKGVNICLADVATLWTTALDGFRMAVKRTELRNDAEPFSVTVPYAFAKAVTNLIPLGKEITLAIYPSMVRVDADSVVLETRLIKGDYPDVRKVMPSTKDAPCLTVDKSEMVAALNRALLAGANNNLVELADDDNGNELTVTSRSEAAQMSEMVSLTNRSADKVDAAFNGVYLQNAVAVYDDEAQNGLCNILLVNGGMSAVIDDGSLYQLVLGVRRSKR